MNEIADAIEERRIALGKTSGFERMYHRVTRLYFGGMARHFESLGRILKPGARLAYVVGDQASYLRVMIRTGELLADVARTAGYEVEGHRSLPHPPRHRNRRTTPRRGPPPPLAGMNDMAAAPDASTRRYQEIIERVFLRRYTPGATEVPFERTDLTAAAGELGQAVPKNLGDVVYSFRYRRPLPSTITDTAPSGKEWAIFPAGTGVYSFRLVSMNVIEPRPGLRRTRIPDSTPGVISRYAMSDEQALLAGVRYNRLLDIFTGVTCYSLQSHLRTSIAVANPISGSAEKSQVETDELYVGIDRHGAHYILPVQAKGGQDSLSIIQIWQDFTWPSRSSPG